MTFGSTPNYDYDRHGVKSGSTGLQLGLLAKQDGFTDPDTASDLIVTCLTSRLATVSGVRATTIKLTSDAIMVDGHDAWHRQTQVVVTASDGSQFAGLQLDVIIVDLGAQHDYLGEYYSYCRMTAYDQLQQLEKAMATLTVVD